MQIWTIEIDLLQAESADTCGDYQVAVHKGLEEAVLQFLRIPVHQIAYPYGINAGRNYQLLFVFFEKGWHNNILQMYVCFMCLMFCFFVFFVIVWTQETDPHSQKFVSNWLVSHHNIETLVGDVFFVWTGEYFKVFVDRNRAHQFLEHSIFCEARAWSMEISYMWRSLMCVDSASYQDVGALTDVMNLRALCSLAVKEKFKETWF